MVVLADAPYEAARKVFNGMIDRGLGSSLGVRAQTPWSAPSGSVETPVSLSPFAVEVTGWQVLARAMAGLSSTSRA